MGSDFLAPVRATSTSELWFKEHFDPHPIVGNQTSAAPAASKTRVGGEKP